MIAGLGTLPLPPMRRASTDGIWSFLSRFLERRIRSRIWGQRGTSLPGYQDRVARRDEPSEMSLSSARCARTRSSMLVSSSTRRASAWAVAMLCHEEVATGIWPAAGGRNDLEAQQFEDVTCEEFKSIAVGFSACRIGDFAEIKHRCFSRALPAFGPSGDPSRRERVASSVISVRDSTFP